jgi:hypothetical protein
MKPRKKVAIHQPDFFPWSGFFNKYLKSDIFVILDNVQFTKGPPGDWTNRTLISNCGTKKWITLPIVRSYNGTKSIREISIFSPQNSKKKILRTLEGLYGNHCSYSQVIKEVSELILFPSESLATYNQKVILQLIEMLQLPKKEILLASEMSSSATGTALLAEITINVGGEIYISGEGGKKYLDVDRLRESGIELNWIGYSQPEYTQCGLKKFLPGLSILDTLMNLGIAGTRSYLLAEMDN